MFCTRTGTPLAAGTSAGRSAPSPRRPRSGKAGLPASCVTRSYQSSATGRDNRGDRRSRWAQDNGRDAEGLPVPAQARDHHRRDNDEFHSRPAEGSHVRMTHWLPGWLPRLDRLSKNWWGYVDLDHGPLPYQESSRASDVLQPVLGLLLPSVNVRRRPLTAAAIVTQLALDIPAGRPFRAENRGGCPLTPRDYGRWRPSVSRALGPRCGTFIVASSTRISFLLVPLRSCGQPLAV